MVVAVMICVAGEDRLPPMCLLYTLMHSLYIPFTEIHTKKPGFRPVLFLAQQQRLKWRFSLPSFRRQAEVIYP